MPTPTPRAGEGRSPRRASRSCRRARSRARTSTRRSSSTSTTTPSPKATILKRAARHPGRQVRGGVRPHMGRGDGGGHVHNAPTRAVLASMRRAEPSGPRRRRRARSSSSAAASTAGSSRSRARRRSTASTPSSCRCARSSRPRPQHLLLQRAVGPQDAPWSAFRGAVLGPTDPAEAPTDSIYGMILAKWEALGLKEVPNTGDNGVHASASPFGAWPARQLARRRPRHRPVRREPRRGGLVARDHQGVERRPARQASAARRARSSTRRGHGRGLPRQVRRLAKL